HQRRDARGLRQARHRSRRQVRPHPARGAAGGVIFLGPPPAEGHAASWFAALGEPLTEGDPADAQAYAGTEDGALVTSWREAEDFLKSAESLDWWNREEAKRKALLARAEAQYSKRALWTALTELTTEAGDLVHGKAAMAAARLGSAAPASIHVAAGAAARALYQLAGAPARAATAALFASQVRP